MSNLIDKLTEIGFTSYEAKAYVALLKNYPSTGYEIAKLADIPQARIYDALKTLEQKSIVIPSISKPTKYTPIKPKVLLTKYTKKINSTINYLEKHLPEVKQNYNEPIITLNNQQEIKEKIIEIIQNAKKEIYIEIWASDFKIYENELLNAYNRNVEVRIVGYDNFKPRFGQVFQHAFGKNIEQSLGGRLIIISIDDEIGAIGKLSSVSCNNNDISLIWTQNQVISFIIKEFIVHDMYLVDVEENLVEQMKYIYGQGFKRLKEKVLGHNATYMIH